MAIGIGAVRISCNMGSY